MIDIPEELTVAQKVSRINEVLEERDVFLPEVMDVLYEEDYLEDEADDIYGWVQGTELTLEDGYRVEPAPEIIKEELE